MHAQTYFTLRDICTDVENNVVKERLNRFFTPLAEAYIDICKIQERQFYGLRDFYRFVHNKTIACVLLRQLFLSSIHFIFFIPSLLLIYFIQPSEDAV